MEKDERLKIALERASKLTWQEYERRAKEILDSDPDLKDATKSFSEGR